MIIRKCDRCGSEIPRHEKNKTLADVIAEKVRSLTEYEMEYIVERTIDGVPDRHLDFCSKCKESFIEWLGGSHNDG